MLPSFAAAPLQFHADAAAPRWACASVAPPHDDPGPRRGLPQPMTTDDIPPIAKLKDKARDVARQFRRATGQDLKHAQALDAVARQYGFDTWAALVEERGAQDASHVNAGRVPALDAAAVGYPTVQALLAAREPDAPVYLSLRPQAGALVLLASDLRRGVQRYAQQVVSHRTGDDPAAAAVQTALYTALDRALRRLKIPAVVATRQEIRVPAWPAAAPLAPLLERAGSDNAEREILLARALAPPKDATLLLAAELRWLSQVPDLARPARRWTFAARDAQGTLVAALHEDGVPLAFASRETVEAMVAWYEGELGGLEATALD